MKPLPHPTLYHRALTAQNTASAPAPSRSTATPVQSWKGATSADAQQEYVPATANAQLQLQVKQMIQTKLHAHRLGNVQVSDNALMESKQEPARTSTIVAPPKEDQHIHKLVQ